ncbi:hypothetical protein J3B02_006331 [Coemansia erecta]|uniref:rRNA-processing protein FYV7 n=1 Tax=Coemansia asiatica TaxID=1052880 RepID=A0A9W7XMX3_9FUNG|nr:hypothetical protein LPJ64_002461 [Coemansia asiatica]KAJ2838935.1 hypothetical protein J3B02_006331 [Coemansia erecta]
MAFSEGSQSTERRRAPQGMALDSRIQRTYKGKLFKQRIERNKASNIKRKYFKELKKEDQDDPEAPSISSEGPSRRNPVKEYDEQESRPSRAPRSNPYEKLMREREEIRRQKLEDRARKQSEIRLVEQKKAKYMQERKEERKKYNARTKRGQPVLSNQIGSLLDKIKRSG